MQSQPPRSHYLQDLISHPWSVCSADLHSTQSLQLALPGGSTSQSCPLSWEEPWNGMESWKARCSMFTRSQIQIYSNTNHPRATPWGSLTRLQSCWRGGALGDGAQGLQGAESPGSCHVASDLWMIEMKTEKVFFSNWDRHGEAGRQMRLG